MREFASVPQKEGGRSSPSSVQDAKAEAYKRLGGDDRWWIIGTLAVTIPCAYLLLQPESEVKEENDLNWGNQNLM
ncbi:hypothetical protein KEM52_000930 [Ascosphaera acerosa]|nr:hypothetical protein KEM52_000930 [Ascosphaera acerosa]